jgi:hypothetical protein
MTAIDMSKGITVQDLRIGDYKIQYFHPTISLPGFRDRQIFDLTDLVTQLSWDFSRERAAKHMSLNFTYHPSLRTILGVGGVIQIFGYAVRPGELMWDELLRMFIIDDSFETDTDAPSVSSSIEVYDQMWYLANNKHTAVFRNMKASEIVISLCEDFGIKYGVIEDTGATIPRLFFRNNSLYDMIITALTESRYTDGQRFIIYEEKGAIYVRKKVLPSKVFVFAYGENQYKVKLSRSLGDMKNRIRLYSNQASGANALTGIVDQGVGSVSENDMGVLQAESNDTFMHEKYGLIADVDTGVSPDRYPTVQAYSDHLLQQKSKVKWEGSITGPAINTMKWGDPIYVYDPLTQMVGQFYVVDGRITITKQKAEMTINAHYEDALPESFFEQYDNINTKDLWDQILKSANLPTLNTGSQFVSPVQGQWPITQEFGTNPSSIQPNGHTGIDIGIPVGTTVYATNFGTVNHSGEGGDTFAGNWMRIDHGNGLESVYAHLLTNSWPIGTKLAPGDPIATSDTTGLATGPHLHFEFRENGVPVNPRKYVLFNTSSTVKQPPASTTVDQTQIRVSAIAYGIDPFLAVAVAWVESKFYWAAQGDARSDTRARGGYCSFGLYQENICGGSGQTYFQNNPNATWDQFLNPEGQIKRFADRIKLVPNQSSKTPGQIAAEAQRPKDPTEYASLVDSIYLKLRNQDGIAVGTGATQVQSVPVGALKLDGSDDYVDCGVGPSLDIIGSITLAAWIKVPVATSGYAGLIFKSNGTTQGYNASMDGLGTGLRMDVYNGTTYTNLTWSGNIADNLWHHVAFLYNAVTGYIRIYLGGAEVANVFAGTGYVSVTTQHLYLGRDPGVGGRLFGGTMKEARVYNRALDPSEIAVLAAGGSPSTVGLKAWWKLNDATGTIAADISGNDNNGVLINFNFDATDGWVGG